MQYPISPDKSIELRTSMRILLVEDNDDHADLVTEIMSIQRLETLVSRVSTGEDAVRFLRNESPFEDARLPELILLDYKLPGISGLDVLRIIKSIPELRGIPVVVLSTSNANRDRYSAYENGANSYAVKPMDFARFQDLVQALVDYWGNVNFTVSR